MYVLYLDEAGTHRDTRCLVVAGLALFERDIYPLAHALDQIQTKYLPEQPDAAPLHASSLRMHAEPPYDALDRNIRHAIIDEVYSVISKSNARLFAVAIDKASVTEDPYERGFEEILNRFDLMLSRVSHGHIDKQQGLVVVAESNYRNNLETLAKKIAREGHRWGETRNLADIPYFAPAKNTRLLQLADFVANAVYGRYEHGYARQFDRIRPANRPGARNYARADSYYSRPAVLLLPHLRWAPLLHPPPPSPTLTKSQ